MRKSKDYTRICGNCGNRWLLPKELATMRKPNRLELAGAKMQSLSDRKAGARLVALQDAKTAALQNGMCPSCGSSDYRQFKPGKAPQA